MYLIGTENDQDAEEREGSKSFLPLVPLVSKFS